MLPELTLADLLAWEPRLQSLSQPTYYASPGQEGRFDRTEVSWAVTIRASAPMLPALRGGELVVLPSRVLADAGVVFAELALEIASRGAAAFLLDREPGSPSSLPMVLVDNMPIDFESEINRLITEKRGTMYRLGTEAGRSMAQIAANGGDLQTALSSAAALLASPVSLFDSSGRMVASSNPNLKIPTGLVTDRMASRELVDNWYGIRLGQGDALWFSDVTAENFAVVRMVGERVASGIETVLAHVAEVRPRGAARSIALAALLTGTEEHARLAAPAMGLHGNAHYRVVLGGGGLSQSALARLLSPLGQVHDAGQLFGREAAVLELSGDPARIFRFPAGTADQIALSEPVTGAPALPFAARQANYIAQLQEANLLRSNHAWFERPDDLGIYRLLFPLWGSPDLERFTRQTLGELAETDKRGVLRETLLVWLESGGSQIDAAERLGIHRNTLAYRVRQITNSVGVDLANPANRLALHLSLVAERLPSSR